MNALFSDLRTVLPYVLAVVAPGVIALALAIHVGFGGLLAGAILFGISDFVAWKAETPGQDGARR